LIPVDAGDHLTEFGGVATGSVDASDEAAHAGASDIADRDAMFFEVFNDADVSESERASAFEDQSDGGTVSGGGRVLR
jgi:hypothetical protein